MKKILSVLLAAILIVSVIPLGGLSEYIDGIESGLLGTKANAAGDVYGGACGMNANWSLDTSTGVLLLSGNGTITDYLAASDVPWASYRTFVKSAVMQNGLTSIGSYLFSYCGNLTSVTIPESVTGIGNYAFYSCSSLASLTIPDGVTGIGNNAFEACRELASVAIGGAVTSIGKRAFYRCVNLAAVTIPDSITSIGVEAFYGTAYYDNSSNWENNVLYIGNHLIKAKPEINGSYTVKNGTKCIADEAFSFCESLTRVTISDGVTGIGNNAFYNCGKLSRITIPDSAARIGDKAFCDTPYYNNSSNWEDNALYIGTHLIKAKSDINGSYTVKNGTKCIADEAFSYCSSLSSVMIPDSVTSIGNCAFKSCGITSVIIPDSVASIGHSTFIGCSALTSVTIGDGISSIGDFAFNACKNLILIRIGDSVTSIGDYAFGSCGSLADITIPSGVTCIGDYAFDACKNLFLITIGDSVTSIGEYAFNNCGSLINITIPDSVTSIGNSAFKACKSLNSVIIGSGVTTLDSGVFDSCTGLASINVSSDNKNYFSQNGVLFNKNKTELIYCPMGKTEAYTIPDGVTSIGNYAFDACKSLTSITISNSVTSIGDYAFNSCSGLLSVVIPDSVISIGIGAFRGCSKIASVTIPDRVTSISNSVFENCSGLTSITIPDGVTSIGGRAFNNCSSLKSLAIPDGTTSIGRGAFNSCSALTSITIPDGVTSIDDYAFEACESLNSVEIGDSVTSIGVSAFAACRNLRSVSIGGNVISIGDNAFEACESLASVTIPNSVTGVGSSVFDRCINLNAITIGDSATGINSSAFDGSAYYNNSSNWENDVLYIGSHLIKAKSGLNGSYTVKSGTKSIANKAFCDCGSLESITIPGSVTSIGGYAFCNCSSLCAVYITDLAVWCGISFSDYYANPIYYAKNLYINGKPAADIVIPEGVTGIGDYAFYNCSNLTSVTIPNSVNRIGNNAFRNCRGLSSLTIPDGVTSIGDSAFDLCTGLASVTIGDGITSIGECAFVDYSRDLILYAKSGSIVEAYAVENGILFIPIACLHFYDSWVIAESATCTAEGSKYRICLKCGETETQTIAALGHDYSSEWTVDAAATAAADGSKSHHCTRCGAKTDVTVIPKLAVKPGATTLGKISNTSAGVKITWNAVADADSFIVYRKAGSAASWSRLAVVDSSKTSYTDTAAKSGTAYTYTVKAQNANGAGGYNKTGLKIIYLTQPTVKVANKNGYVSVSWGKISGAKGYYVYRKAGSAANWSKVATIKDGATVSYADKNIKSGTAYKYTVKAYNGSFVSSYCSGVTTKYLTQPTVKAANKNGYVSVTWGKISGAKGYYVYRKAGSAASWTKVATIKDGAAVSYADKNVKNGSKYKYTVKAFNGSYTSSYCSGIAIEYLTAGKVLSATSAKTGITVKWSKNASAGGYYVYRKTGSGSWSKIATINKNTTVSYVDKSAKKGTTYTYCVRPYNGSYAGTYANSINCKDKY